MKTLNEIKEDLSDIRYYYSRKETFDKASIITGKNKVIDKVNLYNSVVVKISPKLYDIYVNLYIENSTQEALAKTFGYTTDYIQILNKELVKCLQQTIIA